MRRERKVVTVLFADLVGFTARSEELDPEDVEAILRPYHAHLRAELEHYGGTVEKFIGDAVMALFGAPVAHEDDPERAVRAALAIRDWAVEEGGVEVRIAVATGEALVSLDARPAEGEGMAAGDVVNTASRLQSAAPVNGILVGETAFRATRHVIDYRPAEPVEAKGKVEPIPVWEALRARSRFGADLERESPTPLVGREHELGLLTSALARVRQERAPQLVTLVGVPGIGKSRLVAELFRVVDADPEILLWRQGRCLPYGEGVSFWALGDIVKAHAGILEGDDAEAAATKLHRAVADVAPKDPAWVEGHLRQLVGLGGMEAAAGGRDESFAAWRRFLERLAEYRPLVLVFEDLHWADEGLLDFVDHLVDWASDVPILAVCTARPELLDRRPGWGGGKLNAATLSLPPLGEQDTARLIAAVLEKSVLPAEAQTALLERAGGNPLYAEQYARLYVERGSVEAELPETVQGIIAARLDGLPQEEKRLLQDASVHGKVFWSGSLGLDGDADAALHSLARKGFVRRVRSSSVEREEEYSFAHVLVRDVAYGQIPRVDRSEKHRRAASWIESLGRNEAHAEMLAHHYLAALELARASGVDDADLAERARVAAVRAGDRARKLNALASAVQFYDAALALWPTGGPDRGLVLVARARALLRGPGITELDLDDAAAALASADDPEREAEIEVIRAEFVWHRGGRARNRAALDRAWALVGDRPDSEAKALVLSNVSRYLMLSADYDEAVRVGREAYRLAEELGLDELRVATLINIGTSRASRGEEDGAADLEEAIALAEEINSIEGIRGTVNLASITAVGGDMRRACSLHEEGRDTSRHFGTSGNLRWFEAELSTDYCELGRWDEALALAEAFIERVEAGPPHYMECGARQTRGEIRLARGDDAGALADSERELSFARTLEDPQAYAPSVASRAFVLASTGQLDEAERLLDERLRNTHVGRVDGMFGGSKLAEVAVAAGREEDLLAAQPRLRTPWVDAGIAYLTHDFARAADLYEEIGSLTGEARCRLRAARAYVEEGRRAEADEQLARALAFWRSVRATRYVREGERLLAAAG